MTDEGVTLVKNEFQCKQCFSMLLKVYGTDFPKPKRVKYVCPACSQPLYNERTTENIRIKLNEK